MTVNVELTTNEIKYSIEQLFMSSGLARELAQQSMPFFFTGTLTEDERKVAEISLSNRHLIQAVLGKIRLDLTLRISVNSILGATRYLEATIGERKYRVFIAADFLSIFCENSRAHNAVVYDNKHEAIDAFVTTIHNSFTEMTHVLSLQAGWHNLDNDDMKDLKERTAVTLQLYNCDSKMMWIAQLAHRGKGGIWLASGANPAQRELYAVDLTVIDEYVRNIFRYANEEIPPSVTANN
jgi:hypothetical protein